MRIISRVCRPTTVIFAPLLTAFFVTFLYSPFSSAHTYHDGPHPETMMHLKFASGAIHLHAIWTQGPLANSESKLQLEWHSGKDHQPIAVPGPFKVSFSMPEMNHHASPVSVNEIKSNQGQPTIGVFEASKIFLTMDGEWELKVQLKAASTPVETQSKRFTIGNADHPHGNDDHQHGNGEHKDQNSHEPQVYGN